MLKKVSYRMRYSNYWHSNIHVYASERNPVGSFAHPSTILKDDYIGNSYVLMSSACLQNHQSIFEKFVALFLNSKSYKDIMMILVQVSLQS